MKTTKLLNCFLNIDRISSLRNPLFIDFIINKSNHFLNGICINENNSKEDLQFIHEKCPNLTNKKIDIKEIISNRNYNIFNFAIAENILNLQIRQFVIK